MIYLGGFKILHALQTFHCEGYKSASWANMKMVLHEHFVKQILKCCLRTLWDLMAFLKQVIFVYLFGTLKSLKSQFSEL